MARPGTGAQLMQILSRLGEGVRDIANPNLEQEKLFRRFLLQNPERARSLQRAQEQGELQRLADAQETFGGGMVGAVGQVGQLASEEPTNVGQAFGLSPEETESALTLAGVPSATQRVEELTAEQLIDMGIGEERANAIIEQTRAQREKGLFDQEQFNELREQGVPAAEARARTAVAQLEETKSGFKQRMTEWVDNRFQTLNPEERARFALAVSNPGFLQDIQFREQLRSDELLQKMQLRQDRQELFKDKIGMSVKLDDQLAEIEGTLRNEDLSEDEQKLLAARWNALTDLQRMVNPTDPTFSAGREAGFIGGEVKFKPPEEITRDQAVQQMAHKVTSGQVSFGDLVAREDFRELPQEIQEAVRRRIDEADQPTQVRVANWIERRVHPLVRAVGGTIREPHRALASGETATADVTNNVIEFMFGERPIPRQGMIGALSGFEPATREEE